MSVNLNTRVSQRQSVDTVKPAQEREPAAKAETKPAVQERRNQDGMLAPVGGNKYVAPPQTQDAAPTTGSNPKLDSNNQTAKYQPIPNSQLFAADAGEADAHLNDVAQGGLGDCYLMAAMGSVAQANPEAVKNAIKGPDKDGNYTVSFHEKGLFGTKKVDIKVTPDLPVDSNGNPVYAKTHEDGGKKELWPALIEKAYAQWNGGYQNIQNRNPADALFALTGKKTETQAAKDVSLSEVNDMLKGGKAVVISTLDDGKGKTPYTNKGLVTDHAYVVESVDLKNKTVTLRNPWGEGNAPVVLTEAEFNQSLEAVMTNPVK